VSDAVFALRNANHRKLIDARALAEYGAHLRTDIDNNKQIVTPAVQLSADRLTDRAAIQSSRPPSRGLRVPHAVQRRMFFIDWRRRLAASG